MSSILARTPYTRLDVASVGDNGAAASSDVNREFKKLASQQLGMFVPTVLVSARSPYTVKATDWLILCDCTAGAITLTFPLAARVDGLHVVIVKTDASANAVTLSGTFSGLVNPTLTARYQNSVIDAGNGVYYATAHSLSVGAHLSLAADGTLTTDATSANTPGAIVARDGSGGIAVGNLVANAGATVTGGSLTIGASWDIIAVTDLLLDAGAGHTVQLRINGVPTLEIDSSATAGDTRMLLYCVDTGTVSRVKTDAPGTGGPGGVGRALYI